MAKKKKKFNLNEITLGGVDQKELTAFTRQFSTLINAGLEPTRSLDIVVNMLKPGVLRNSLRDIKEELEQGSDLPDALSHYPKTFDNLYVNMVRAGQKGGILGSILERLADFREKSEKIARDVKSAMMYPTVVVVIAFIIVLAIMIFVVPNFQEMFENMGLQLPAPTQILINVSDMIQNDYHLPVIVVGSIFATIFVLKRFQKGRYLLDLAKLYIPIFGNIIKKGAISRFCRTLGSLLKAGVNLVEALMILRNAAGNEVLAALIDEVITAVKTGEPMTKPLHKSKLFESMAVSMIEVGDESGEVDAMLEKIADIYDNEIDALVSGMKSMIEPILIGGLGITIGFIVIALFMPLVEMMQNFGQ